MAIIWDETADGIVNNLLPDTVSAWFRWQVNVPQGCLINEAKVTFKASLVSGTPTAAWQTMRILDDFDFPDYSVDPRATAVAAGPTLYRDVVPAMTGSVGDEHEYDITPLIQWAVAQPGWASGKYINLVCLGDSVVGGGSGQVEWQTFDNGGHQSEIFIDYTNPGSGVDVEIAVDAGGIDVKNPPVVSNSLGINGTNTTLWGSYRVPVNVPGGSTISSAKLYMPTDFGLTGTGTYFTTPVQRVDVSDMPAYDYDIGTEFPIQDDINSGTGYGLTGPVINWDLSLGDYAKEDGFAPQDVWSPDFSSIFQDFIDDPSYSPGNHICLIFKEGLAAKNDFYKLPSRVINVDYGPITWPYTNIIPFFQIEYS